MTQKSSSGTLLLTCVQNFAVDLNIYPSAFFNFTMAVGLFLVRRSRKRLNIPAPSKKNSFRAWHIAVLFTIAVNLYLLIMPWYPPTGGADGGDVSFWYATYVVTGIGILIACGVYYVLWVYALPRWRGYRIRHERLVLEGGEVTHKLIKVPVERLDAWDREHDAQGGKIDVDGSSDGEVVDVQQHQFGREEK